MKKILFAALLVASQLSHAEWFAAAITPAPSQVIWLNVQQPTNPTLSSASAPTPIAAYLDNIQLYSEVTNMKINVLQSAPNLPSGTTLYIGYGANRDQMIANGSYRAFYRYP